MLATLQQVMVVVMVVVAVLVMVGRWLLCASQAIIIHSLLLGREE